MTDQDLIKLAREVRERAYAPYSNFKVGAALLTAGGQVFTGVNVENISYGLTMCAERVALGKAIAEGHADFHAVAVASDSAEPVVPCGACRQVLAEFNPDLRVISSTLTGAAEALSLSALFPIPKRGILG